MRQRAVPILVFALCLGVRGTAETAWEHCDAFSVTDNHGEIAANGTGYNSAWFTYVSKWMNAWFYAGQYDPDRYLNAHIEFDLMGIPTDIPEYPEDFGHLIVGVNWAKPAWSALGQNHPPLPSDFTYSESETPDETETVYIFRQELLNELNHPEWFGPEHADGTRGDFIPVPGGRHFSFDVTVSDYNPEWISVDVVGNDYVIANGSICYSCLPAPDSSTLPLGVALLLPTLGGAGWICVRRLRHGRAA